MATGRLLWPTQEDRFVVRPLCLPWWTPDPGVLLQYRHSGGAGGAAESTGGSAPWPKAGRGVC